MNLYTYQELNVWSIDKLSCVDTILLQLKVNTASGSLPNLPGLLHQIVSGDCIIIRES